MILGDKLLIFEVVLSYHARIVNFQQPRTHTRCQSNTTRT
jgi:hypothetical protein